MLENEKFRDIFYQFFHVPWMNFQMGAGFTESKKLNLSDVFIGFARLFAKIGLALPTLFVRPRKRPFLLISGTFNNFNTLDKLARQLPSSTHVSIMGSRNPKQKFPDIYCYLRGLMKLAALKTIYDSLSLLERRAFIRRFDVAIWVAGSGFVLKKYIGRVSPDIVVLANDHSPFARVIFHVAAELGVVTAYIPHAPVSKEFPPLRMDHAFLDGEIQRELYERDGCKTEIVGAIRYEHSVKDEAAHSKNNGVIVCFNRLDSLSFADGLLAELRQLDWVSKGNIFVRIHPADFSRRGAFRHLASKYGAFMQDSTEPISQNGDIGIMFAGSSGVLIDGLMLGLRLVSLKGWYDNDYYELARHHCIEIYDNLNLVPENASLNAKNASIFNKHLEQKQKLPSQLVAAHLIEIRNNLLLSDTPIKH